MFSADKSSAVIFVDVNALESSRQNDFAADSAVGNRGDFGGVCFQMVDNLSDNRRMKRCVKSPAQIAQFDGENFFALKIFERRQV